MNTNLHIKPWCLIGLGVIACAVPAVKAVSPYSPDADTLHLWHFDESPAGSLPAIEATESVSGSSFNLNVTNAASLMAPAYSTALVGSLDTRARQDSMAVNDISYTLDNLRHPTTGAFTYEALVYPTFDPTGTLAGRSSNMEIICFDSEAGSTTNRFFQFRLKQPATTNDPWSVEFANIGSHTPAVGSNTWVVTETVEDFSGNLSSWNGTTILDAGGTTSNTAYWQIAGGNLELQTDAFDGIEQYAMIKSGLALAVGEELRAYITHNANSQDLGLYVGGTEPVAGTRQDYVAVYARNQQAVYSRGFDGTGEYGLLGGTTAMAIEGVFIKRTLENTYETGWFNGSTRTVLGTRTPATPNAGNVVGVYADVRARGTLSGIERIVKVEPGNTLISPAMFSESFSAPLPVDGVNAAAADNWYHVAVTYSGSENTADNLKIYWTRLSGTAATANLIGSFQMTNDVANAAVDLTGEFAVGNESRGTSSENFVGRIDEVRVSSTERTSEGFQLGGTPYAVDGNTRVLLHFNDTHASVPDSTADIAHDAVSVNPLNLAAYDGPVFGTNAYTGFGLAIGFDNTANPGNRLAVNEDTALRVTNYVDSVTGAFTLEALIQPAWSGAPVQNMEIISAENDGGATERPWQFRVQAGANTLRFDPIGTDATTMDVPLPTSGPHELVPGAWYHVAITYNGNEGEADNVTFYWTRLDSGATQANVLTNFTQTVDPVDPADSGELCIGNEQRDFTNSAGDYDDEEFIGLIDEVRISKVARTATQFVFADGGIVIDPFNLAAVAISGGNAILTWESQSGATYTILRKSALPAGSWDTVKSGIASAGDGTTSDSVPVSGSDQEFYQVKGE